MRRASSVVLTLCQTALFASCATPGDTPTAPSATANSPSLDRLGTVTITGGCGTSYELTNLQFQAPPNDADLAHADYSDGGGCQLSHLGATTLVNSGSIDFTIVPAHGTGTFTLTAANGDRLEGTEENEYLTPDENGHFGFTGVLVVTGGTGRFAGAHGMLTTSGTGSTEESTTLQFHTGQVGF
jgi:hypothetical protein